MSLLYCQTTRLISPHDIEVGMTNVPTIQDKLPSHTVSPPSTAAVILTNDTKRSLPNNIYSLTEAGQHYYNMDVHPLKQEQKRIQDADQMAKSSPFLLPVVCVTTVMIFVIGLFVLYQVHGSDVEE